jgi:hypothetical protein
VAVTEEDPRLPLPPPPTVPSPPTVVERLFSFSVELESFDAEDTA